MHLWEQELSSGILALSEFDSLFVVPERPLQTREPLARPNVGTTHSLEAQVHHVNLEAFVFFTQ
jgi:hypothetical protein